MEWLSSYCCVFMEIVVVVVVAMLVTVAINHVESSSVGGSLVVDLGYRSAWVVMIREEIVLVLMQKVRRLLCGGEKGGWHAMGRSSGDLVMFRLDCV